MDPKHAQQVRFWKPRKWWWDNIDGIVATNENVEIDTEHSEEEY